ncbi:MAG: amidohydrolase family protein [Betaproteobacteria bacterium]|nr:amidohydrolase family protein [Betaproteobacteria bacterium]
MNMTCTHIAKLILLAPVTALLAVVNARAASEPDTWFLRGAKIYIAPDRELLKESVVVIRGDKIMAVGEKGKVAIPAGARESTCSGGIITAGFQNSHVHLIGETWNAAGTQPANELTKKLVTMLTRYGYSTVVDIASDRDNTLALRARIERDGVWGEVRGPRILTAGLPLFPPNGIPIYLDNFPREFLESMPQPASIDAALKVVRENLDAGADATKLFIATPQARQIQRMPADIARAAADETHRRGKLVIAHPTDIAGVDAALAAGVDILAHTTLGVATPWPDALRQRAIQQGMSVIPTLKLMGYEMSKENAPPAVTARLVDASVAHVRTFIAAGGQVLFGTDVGYMNDADPAEEYLLMAKAGMSPMQILASLTTTPAARWKESGRRGRVAAGLDADLVVLGADPAADVANFATVRCTISRGRTIYPGSGE